MRKSGTRGPGGRKKRQASPQAVEIVNPPDLDDPRYAEPIRQFVEALAKYAARCAFAEAMKAVGEKATPPEDAREVLTIREFCAAYRISQSMFHKMQSEGWAPTVMRVGSRTLISAEAAAAWQRKRERERKSHKRSHNRPRKPRK